MSSTISVAEYAGVIVDNYCEVAATALIIYDSIIITGQEARYFWSERLTGAAVLFYLNKYLTLLSFVYTMFGFVTVTIASRVSLIVADCLLIIITWCSVSSPQHVQMRKNTFATVLLRDGLIYFLSLLILNSLHLVLTMLSESNIPSLQDASFVSLFAEPLTTILVSRFLLHLQSAKHKTTGVDTAFGMTSSRTTSIIFDRVIGSLDQSLSVDDFLGPAGGPEEDDIDIAPKSSKECRTRSGDWEDCESPMSKVGYDVFELPVRSHSIEEGVPHDIVEVY
ncbi:hypothetical protein GSI_12479 [Ganoderma sinense ZZ0214-1]|uniref:DUF6533 domain-containing protein n=1 Tax=Ganoderma sinense ZZ0214-1 TaxID=1077348 RepID=A0A2G8RSV3_9APHY|nr:hypothetical protein GSI_12479 [Ganoderma sinense ZZ0214-1]